MTIACDICVIGAGSGGLTVAAAAAQFGRKVVLIERGKMGGDCLNYGCVPSKALIAAAKHAQSFRSAEVYGIASAEPRIDFGKVHDHIQGVIAAIAPNDSQARFEGLGVRVIRAAARFIDPSRVEAGGEIIEARRFVIATGSRPVAPPIPGIDTVPYLTNETIFDQKKLPGHLLIIGGGPIGLELAQAFVRLGAKVAVLEAATPLAKEDPVLARIVLDRLRSEGVEILSPVKIESVSESSAGVSLIVADSTGQRDISGTHLLVAAGRKPNIEDLGLDAAGIAATAKGITIDSGLRTSNRKVYAIGDVAGGLQFTHAAADHAGLVIRNALFRLPVKARTSHIPWVTFTDPELARIGLSEPEARTRFGDGIRIVHWPFTENDRAQTERRTDGLVKAVIGRRGRILGAAIVGAGAGELIHSWALAMSAGLSIKAIAGMVPPYPTMGEASRRAAISYFSSLAANSFVRGVIGLLARFG